MNILGFDITFKRAAQKEVESAEQFADALTVEKIIETPAGKMPVSSGRSSESENSTAYDSLLDAAIINPDFQVELLGALEVLAKKNPDISYALDNIVQLGNTPYTIHFPDNLPEGQEIEMLQEVRRVEKQWYSNSGGIVSLRNDLLAQVAITGAISLEKIPNNSLDGISKVVLVNPKTVRFAYNSVEDTYEPYQISKMIMGKSGSSVVGMNKLNTATYTYLALRRFNESPYGIPPFLSALDNTDLESYMMQNMRSIIKKLGILGFLNVLVNQPVKTKGTDEEYAKEVKNYLNEVANSVEKGLGKGFIVGYKNNHSFNMESVNNNVEGATALFKLNSEMKMAGLKQDPLMLGRNYSTTETIGRVILAKLSAQIKNYQVLADQVLADTIKMHLWLKGYNNLEYVLVESTRPMIGDESREQEAYSKTIDNAIKLYNEGIIDQEKKAQICGYDKPALEEPIKTPEGTTNTPIPSIDAPTSEDPAAAKTTDYGKLSLRVAIPIAERLLGGHHPEFYYGDESCGCGENTKVTLEEFLRTPNALKALNKYATALNKKYSKAVNSLSYKVALALQSLSKGENVNTVTDNVLYTIFTNWDKLFKQEIKDDVSNFVTDAYSFFRQSKAPFANITGEVPDYVFDLSDFRAIDYYAKSDSLYLGKFITDADTKKRVTQWIKDEYLKDGMPIGKSPEGVTAFRAAFEDVLIAEDWKIARIIDTTVSRMRNTAALNYMDQAQITTFSIFGIGDRLQCGYCKEFNGRSFDVKRAIQIQSDILQTEPEYIGDIAPFVTSKKVELTPETISQKTAEEIQSLGIGVPSYHPNCRCTVVADQ